MSYPVVGRPLHRDLFTISVTRGSRDAFEIVHIWANPRAVPRNGTRTEAQEGRKENNLKDDNVIRTLSADGR